MALKDLSWQIPWCIDRSLMLASGRFRTRTLNTIHRDTRYSKGECNIVLLDKRTVKGTA